MIKYASYSFQYEDYTDLQNRSNIWMSDAQQQLTDFEAINISISDGVAAILYKYTT